MIQKVLLTDDITPEVLEVFKAYPALETVRTGTLEPARLGEKIPDYHAIVVRSPTKLTAEILAKARKLRFIGRAGMGTDNIDLDAANELGIVVMNAPHANSISTAEHTIAIMLALARRLPHAHRAVTGGEWDRKKYMGIELYRKTLGIIGLGAVGREVARRMSAFSMKVIASDPYVENETASALGVELVPLEALLERSDVITLHVPLDESTRGLIGAAEIEAMKNGVIIVNCARGGVVDEKALTAALLSGKVQAAGLDVFETEPPGKIPAFEHHRSVFTPHLGAATAEAQVRVATDVAKSVAEALTKGVIRNAVNRPPHPR